MSVNFNRSKANKCKTRKEIKLKVIYDQDPYFEDYWSKRGKGRIWAFKFREYRSWKYNRKTQYK